ncbi:polycomb group protein FIE2-like, partial [Phragmites australis]|uniref:polycomb group protein FIE2-like n=1 Tax=Phragmites australis TaxID=29695 RepID=UPI002D78C060
SDPGRTKLFLCSDAVSLGIELDESVRLWNVHRGICILIFAGAGGHRNEVLSVDFHPSDINRFASCGMDHTVKIWSMKEFWPYVDKSYSWIDLPSKFPTKYVQFPVLIAAVHSNYVDCTRWLADFILSKKYPVPECDIWFIKFSRDFHFNQLAIGNREGKSLCLGSTVQPTCYNSDAHNPK